MRDICRARRTARFAREEREIALENRAAWLHWENSAEGKEEIQAEKQAVERAAQEYREAEARQIRRAGNEAAWHGEFLQAHEMQVRREQIRAAWRAAERELSPRRADLAARA